jgi:hypothetical protein
MKDLEVSPVFYAFFATETHAHPEVFPGLLLTSRQNQPLASMAYENPSFIYHPII